VAELKQILEELTGIAGQDRVKVDPAVTARYAVDGVIPRAVAFPTNTKMVADVVRCAARGGLAMAPCGSGTKLALGNPPKRLDLVVSTARMNHMLDVDTANLTITAEAGVKLRDIQARLATQEDRCYLPLENLVAEAGEFICSDRSNSGCFLPLDPPFGEKATIGGIVATNSSGPKRLLYGLPRDLVLGLRFVTPGGEIVGAGGKTVKNVSGYDVSKLMIGSMGSLGILCEMTLRLLPLPESMETLVFGFDLFSDAGGFATAVLGTKLLPAAVEVVNRKGLEVMELGAALAPGNGSHFVLIALEAFREAVTRMAEELPGLARKYNVKSHVRIPEEKHRLFWLQVGELQERLAGRDPGLVALQLNYPLSAWKSLYEFAEQKLPHYASEYTLLCHAGSGVNLINFLSDPRRPGSKGVTDAVRTLTAECRKSGGNVIIQRAPAEAKHSLPVWGEAGPDMLLMKKIREELDPAGLMNPGRFAV
jgi:glycolate oxidase FAD binding subunit